MSSLLCDQEQVFSESSHFFTSDIFSMVPLRGLNDNFQKMLHIVLIENICQEQWYWWVPLLLSFSYHMNNIGEVDENIWQLISQSES